MSEGDARDAARRLATGQWDLDDFLDQLRAVRRLGPGAGALLPTPADGRGLARIEAIILSMTPAERAAPEHLDRSRLRRIALGSGTSELAVRRLIKQFGQMRQAIRNVAGGDRGRPG